MAKEHRLPRAHCVQVEFVELRWRDEVLEFGKCNGGTNVIGGDKKTKGQ